MRPAAFWASLLVTGTAVEIWAVTTKRDHWTLSVSARRWLRTETPLGSAASTVFIGSGAAWLAHHLRTIPLPPLGLPTGENHGTHI